MHVRGVAVQRRKQRAPIPPSLSLRAILINLVQHRPKLTELLTCNIGFLIDDNPRHLPPCTFTHHFRLIGMEDKLFIRNDLPDLPE